MTWVRVGSGVDRSDSRGTFSDPGERQTVRPGPVRLSGCATWLGSSAPEAYCLVQQARTAGLLRPDAIERLLREAMKKRQVDQLFTTMDKLANLQPVLTETEIDAEIAAGRARRR
jgi:hypothetical protein